MRPMDPTMATDQLTLELATALPRLPARLRPMMARPAPAPFDSAEHLFEPAWGGRRVLAFVEPAVEADGAGGWLTVDGAPSVRLLDARGRDLADRLPELRSLALRLEARSAVLDGEVVVVGPGGRADPGGLRRRLAGPRHGADASAIDIGPGAAGPVAYLVFDVLYLDGRSLLALSLARRRALLARSLRSGPEIVTVPAVEGEGVALHAAVAGQRLAGIRARVTTSPYLPGVRSLLWRSVRSDVRPDTETTEPSAEMPGSATGGPVPGSSIEGAGPVLAVIRRLPLEEVAPADGLAR